MEVGKADGPRLSKYKETLFIALARLIQDRTITARSKNGEETLIGKNLDIENKDSADLPVLFMYWCHLCTTGDLSAGEYGEGISDDEIPRGFREARRNGKHALSQAHFAQMKKSGVDNPWMQFSGKQLLELLPSSARKLDTGIAQACEEMEGHCCIPDICENTSQLQMQAFSAVRNFFVAVEASQEYIRLGHLQKAQMVLEESKKAVDDGFSLQILKTNERFRNASGLGKCKNENGLTENPSTTSKDETLKKKVEWTIQLRKYREKIIRTSSFEYHLLLIAAADPETQYPGISIPPIFRSSWGQRTKQKECHESNHELRINKRKADMLARGGFAPPLLHNYVFWHFEKWAAMHQEEEEDSELHPGYKYRPADAEERRAMSDEITNQIIAYLEMQISTMSHTEVLTSLSQSYDPSDWCKLFNMWDNPINWIPDWALPRDERVTDPSDANRVAWGVPRRGFLPFGVEKLGTSEEKQVMSKEWVRNIIKPMANLFFNRQTWKHYGDDDNNDDDDDDEDGDDDDEDGDDDDEDGDEDIQQDGGKAYQRLMKCDIITRFHSATEQDIARFPSWFFTSSPEIQHMMALGLAQQEARKRNELVTLALSHILAEVGQYGTCAFRTPASPVVLSAARKAFSEKGMAMFPFKVSPFCNCENEQKHLLVETEILAHAICERMDKLGGDTARPLNENKDIVDPTWAESGKEESR